MRVDKETVIKAFVEKFESELSALILSAKTAHAAATHEESRAEDRHDTFAIEASYLAAGQAARVAELQKTLQEFNGFLGHLKSAKLISYQCDQGIFHALFAHLGGGTKIHIDSDCFQVLSVKSSLGEELMHSNAGESVVFEHRGVEKEYRIIAVI